MRSSEVADWLYVISLFCAGISALIMSYMNAFLGGTTTLNVFLPFGFLIITFITAFKKHWN